MKKVILALGVSALAVSLNADKSYADSSAVVDVSALNVRSGPSLNYSKIGVVYRGSSLNVIETQGEWSHVELNNGMSGKIVWINKSELACPMIAIDDEKFIDLSKERDIKITQVL